jgi:hypothetical protein
MQPEEFDWIKPDILIFHWHLREQDGTVSAFPLLSFPAQPTRAAKTFNEHTFALWSEGPATNRPILSP